MDQNTPGETRPPNALKPARIALNVLALCFALSVLGRGLGESFTVFLKPISESFGWDRAQVVSVYSLTWLAGGLTAPLVGRLFDRSGPRMVYSLGLFLLGSAFLIAPHARRPLAIPAERRALRRARHRPDRQCAELDPARPLVRPAAADRDGDPVFGDRRRHFDAAAGLAAPDRPDRLARRLPAVRHRGAVPAAAAAAAAVAAVRQGSPHIARKPTPSFVDNGWTLGSAMRHHAFWALFSTFFFTAVAMYAHHRADRRLSDRCRISAAAGGDRLGIFRRRAAVRHARHLARSTAIIGRRPSVLFSYGVSIVGIILLWLIAILSELLAADRLSSSASAA